MHLMNLKYVCILRLCLIGWKLLEDLEEIFGFSFKYTHELSI
jgi:hypothetical protein